METKLFKAKDFILQTFKRNEELLTKTFGEEEKEIAESLVKLLKEKELTYEEAYAALELAYEILKYESNFASIK